MKNSHQYKRHVKQIETKSNLLFVKPKEVVDFKHVNLFATHLNITEKLASEKTKQNKIKQKEFFNRNWKCKSIPQDL